MNKTFFNCNQKLPYSAVPLIDGPPSPSSTPQNILNGCLVILGVLGSTLAIEQTTDWEMEDSSRAGLACAIPVISLITYVVSKYLPQNSSTQKDLEKGESRSQNNTVQDSNNSTALSPVTIVDIDYERAKTALDNVLGLLTISAGLFKKVLVKLGDHDKPHQFDELLETISNNIGIVQTAIQGGSVEPATVEVISQVLHHFVTVTQEIGKILDKPVLSFLEEEFDGDDDVTEHPGDISQGKISVTSGISVSTGTSTISLQSASREQLKQLQSEIRRTLAEIDPYSTNNVTIDMTPQRTTIEILPNATQVEIATLIGKIQTLVEEMKKAETK